MCQSGNKHFDHSDGTSVLNLILCQLQPVVSFSQGVPKKIDETTSKSRKISKQCRGRGFSNGEFSWKQTRNLTLLPHHIEYGNILQSVKQFYGFKLYCLYQKSKSDISFENIFRKLQLLILSSAKRKLHFTFWKNVK